MPRRGPDWTAEQRLQAQIVDYLTHALPADAIFNAVNPVPAKSKAAAGKSKRMGARRGWPDLEVICGDTILIEVKAPGESVPRYQRDLHAQLTAAGAYVYIARSVDEVDRILRSHAIPMTAEVV